MVDLPSVRGWLSGTDGQTAQTSLLDVKIKNASLVIIIIKVSCLHRRHTADFPVLVPEVVLSTL